MSGPEVYASGAGDGTHPDQAFCLCGNAWFSALVSIEHGGEVNGWVGPLTCTECGATMPADWRGARNPDGSWFDPEL